MAGIGNRWGVRAAQWLLDGVMMRRLPLWQRFLLAALLVLFFVLPPVVVAVILAAVGLHEANPGWLLLSAALAGVTIWFWWSELQKYRGARKK